MTGQMKSVFDLMADGTTRTLAAIATILSISDSSAGARLRDLRKSKFGAHTVTRSTEKPFTYTLVPNANHV